MHVFINLVTYKIPSEGDDDELHTLVMRVKRHKHTCQKNERRRCTLSYTKDPSPETHLETNAYGGNKARFYVIKKETSTETVNPYEEPLLRV